MHLQSRRRALVAAGLVSFGLVAPVAATATAAPAKPAPKAPQYVAEVMGPRAEPQPYSFGTRALGISNPGEVLVATGSGEALVATGGRTRALPSTDSVTPYHASATVISDGGDVYGGSYDKVVKRTRTTAAAQGVHGLGGSHEAVSVQAVNARADVAGCSGYYRIGYPFIGSFTKDTVAQVAWPEGTTGNCSVTGISDRGVATVNQEAPYYRHEEIYPRAATMTTGGVRFLKTPEGLGSTADAISPNGMLIVGRVYKDGVPTTSWLSHRRAPQALRGAGAMTPKVVTNRAVVFGEKDGRVVMWQAGRTTDLTKATRLPRGWVLTGVSDINRRGQLSVTATIPSRGENVAMRLTPVGARR